jgi:chemotaxis signal transduction protein
MSATEPADGEADGPIDHVEFLRFELDGDSYALELGRVRQTMEVPQTSRVPNAPDLVTGVASVTGDITVVVDGRAIVGGRLPRETGLDPMMLLVDHGGSETMEALGLVIDEVGDIDAVHVDDVRPIDGSGAGETPPGVDDRWFRAVIVDDGDGSGRPPDPTCVFDVAALIDGASA